MDTVMIFGTLFLGLFLSRGSDLYAKVEIPTEGAAGWGLCAPTWRKKSAIYSAVMNGKELTGYHKVMFVLPLYMLSGVFVLDRYWSGEWRLFSLQHVIEVLSFYLMMSVNWDFRWFPNNQYFGIKRFKRGEIHWHRKWIGPVPVDYVGGLLGFAALTAVIGLFLGADSSIWWRQGLIAGVVLSGTCVSILRAPAYQRKQIRLREQYGSLTEDWKEYLTAQEYDELHATLRGLEDLRNKAAELGRIRAQREQLGVPKPYGAEISRP